MNSQRVPCPHKGLSGAARKAIIDCWWGLGHIRHQNEAHSLGNASVISSGKLTCIIQSAVLPAFASQLPRSKLSLVTSLSVQCICVTVPTDTVVRRRSVPFLYLVIAILGEGRVRLVGRGEGGGVIGLVKFRLYFLALRLTSPLIPCKP